MLLAANVTLSETPSPNYVLGFINAQK